MEARNCLNHKGLTEDALAVTEYTPDVVDEHKTKKAAKVWGLGDIRLYECPLSYITAETNEMISAVYRSENGGRLLFGGEWADQPCWFVDAMDIYRHEQARRVMKENGERKKS